MSKAVQRALFLDRDGVINVDHGYVFQPEQTQWVPGIFDLCRKATTLEFQLVVVTNQAGIARGYYKQAQFEAYTRWMHGEFAERGLVIAATYHCPHHPTDGLDQWRRDCGCRKPKAGMILRAQRELGIDLAASALIGDKETDIQAAVAAGVGRSLLVGASSPVPGVDSVPSLKAAIGWLVAPNKTDQG